MRALGYLLLILIRRVPPLVGPTDLIWTNDPVVRFIRRSGRFLSGNFQRLLNDGCCIDLLMRMENTRLHMVHYQ